jgi:tellurite resistance protein TehA-like permease
VRQTNAERPFKTPLYPVLPILFALSSVAMLWSALSYVTADSGAGALVSLCVLGSGIIALFFVARAKTA